MHASGSLSVDPGRDGIEQGRAGKGRSCAQEKILEIKSLRIIPLPVAHRLLLLLKSKPMCVCMDVWMCECPFPLAGYCSEMVRATATKF